jgi:hypothetical protein
MEVAGCEVPETFQGRSLFGGALAGATPGAALSAEGEEVLRQRLAGLGYIA